MNSNLFPFNYIKSTFPPTKAFKNRRILNWPQIFFVFLLLTLVMVLPVFKHYHSVELFNLEDFYPKVVDLIDDEAVKALQETTIDNGKLSAIQPFTIESEAGVISVGWNSNAENISDTVLSFQENQYVIRDEIGEERIVPYLTHSTLGHDHKASLLQELDELFTAHYRSELVVSLTMVVYGFIVLFTLFIVFLYAYLVKSMQDFTMSSIVTYKESVNLILNLILIPTIGAVIFGLIRFNIILMMTIQVIGLISMLFYIYRTTRFED